MSDFNSNQKDFKDRFKKKCLLHEIRRPLEGNCIVIGGMVSCGKSTIVERLAKQFNFIPYYELPNDKNNLMYILLDRMYQRVEVAPSVCQLQFLLYRFSCYRDGLKSNIDQVKVFDRSIFEDRLFAFFNMLDQPNVFEYYEKLWRDKINELLYVVGVPKLHVILSLDWETFKERLFKRNREIEIKNFERNKTYFHMLNECYVEYLKNICDTYFIPYIVIDAKQSVDEEIKLIQQKLIELKIIK